MYEILGIEDVFLAIEKCDVQIIVWEIFSFVLPLVFVTVFPVWLAKCHFMTDLRKWTARILQSRYYSHIPT